MINKFFCFDDKKKAHLIYALNGVRKTAFANTIKRVLTNI